MNHKEEVISKWMNIAITKRTEEVIEQCDEKSEEVYSELTKLLNEVKSTNPNLSGITDRIENIFLLKTRVDTEFVYPLAIEEGIELGKKLK
ncbi:hypothetical protein [Paenibacillus gallinarum]|uniref:NTP pyrophosphohydrolase MazG putative catalytic core domain-containing protein n=1 Tax=Paenibacillus gallinarum TaxID=2762232 RepID=A0ABR8SWB0_9BACL|nr:hypothetical protein [Paenibacillus gallinarum]MBD7967795.1 hypothetical protein [Paenibacillus gallinarum]